MNPFGNIVERERERARMASKEGEKSQRWHSLKWKETEEDRGGEGKEREAKAGKEEQRALLNGNWLSN